MVSYLAEKREKLFLVDSLIVTRLNHGVLNTNSYILRAKEDEGFATVIDPGEDFTGIVNAIEANHLNVDLIVLTHGHFDHACSSGSLSKKYGGKIAMSSEDMFLLQLNREAMRKLGIKEECDFWVDIDLSKVNSLPIHKSFSLEVLRTPGHTPGSVVLLSPTGSVAFTGDTLFRGFVGRTDFPGGSEQQLKDSLKMLLEKAKEDSLILPGHGEETRLKYEKEWLEQWLNER